MSARSSELDIEKDGVVKVEPDKVYGQDGGAAADQLSQWRQAVRWPLVDGSNLCCGN